MHCYLDIYALHSFNLRPPRIPQHSARSCRFGSEHGRLGTVSPSRAVETGIAPHPANIQTHIARARNRVRCPGRKFKMFTLEVVQCMPPPPPSPESISRETCPHKGGNPEKGRCVNTHIIQGNGSPPPNQSRPPLYDKYSVNSSPLNESHRKYS